MHVVGIGEDGVAGLAEPARNALARAEVVIGGDRHHSLAPHATGERRTWPSPFDAMIDEIRSLRGRRPVILVTGDPLWYSVGARLLRAFGRNEIAFHPQLSAFQWAACRMGWSLADCETLTVHGRAPSQILPYLAPRVRLLLLTQDASTPSTVAQMLSSRGFGRSTMAALAALGGAREERFEGRADTWGQDVPDFHTLAVECVADADAQWFARGGGLPDEAFEHDGQITKRDLRASALAKLRPFRGATLWDLGCGCGSVSIEWVRAAPEARAIAVDRSSSRLAFARANADALGAPRLALIEGHLPDALPDEGEPDAVFIGGGASVELLERARKRLRIGGTLVAHGVTLETESLLAATHGKDGGELVRIQVAHTEPIGPFRGWRPAMPVTQYVWHKR